MHGRRFRSLIQHKTGCPTFGDARSLCIAEGGISTVLYNRSDRPPPNASRSLAPAAFAFIEQADAFYTALTQAVPHRGGRLFYAGELTDTARPAIAAANIAGAATLAVSADQSAAKQAMRDGIVDFVVNSLDEALRILKNEIRKRETVAVCVTAAPAAIESEMRDRGVLPDITFSALTPQPSQAGTWLTLRPAQSAAQWLPRLDALTLEILPPEQSRPAAGSNAPRVTWAARPAISASCTSHTTSHRSDRGIRNQIATGTIQVAIEIDLGPWTNSKHQTLPSPSDL